MVGNMNINEILKKKGITKYILTQISGISNTTISNILSGKTHIEKCSAETVYKLSKALDVSMESLVENAIYEHSELNEYEKAYEYGLPPYLQKDLDAYKEGLKNKSSLLDCLWGELYGSINAAEIDDGAITSEHAKYLRKKFLGL